METTQSTTRNAADLDQLTTMSTAVFNQLFKTEAVRADELKLGDFTVSEWWDGSQKVEQVLEMRLLNDDVELNDGAVLMSRSTLCWKLVR